MTSKHLPGCYMAANHKGPCHTDTKPYCKPWEAGLDSTGRSVAVRLGRLLTALDCEVTSYVVNGQIDHDISALKRTIIDKLRAEGWGVRYDDNSHRYRVAQPKRR